MWPEPVERIAAFLRESEAQGRIEELPPDVDEPPGAGVRVAGFDCDGRAVVVLVPTDRAIDRQRVARRRACSALRPAPAGSFPFQGASVFVDRSLLSLLTVWLEAGSPRHVLGLAPRELLRLTHAETGVFLSEN